MSKKRPGGARLDLLVFYSVFKRPRLPGGKSGGALITYRLGRLTELKHHKIKLLCTFKKYGNLPNTHWSAGRHGVDLKATASAADPS